MVKNIDLDYIRKWVDISEEELMQRLVKDAVGLQKEAKEKEKAEIIKKRKNDSTYNIAFVKKFFDMFEYLNQFFTDEEILEACKNHMGKGDLTKEQVIRGYHTEDTDYYTVLTAGGTYSFEEHRSSWSREVRDIGTKVLMRNQYQGVRGAHDVALELLLKKCPFLSEYELKVYDLNERNDWFFVENPNNKNGYAESSLYVPFSAVMNKDPEKILKTHRNYWHEYGNGKYDEITDKFLASDFVQEFLAKVAK